MKFIIGVNTPLFGLIQAANQLKAVCVGTLTVSTETLSDARLWPGASRETASAFEKRLGRKLERAPQSHEPGGQWAEGDRLGVLDADGATIAVYELQPVRRPQIWFTSTEEAELSKICKVEATEKLPAFSGRTHDGHVYDPTAAQAAASLGFTLEAPSVGDLICVAHLTRLLRVTGTADAAEPASTTERRPRVWFTSTPRDTVATRFWEFEEPETAPDLNPTTYDGLAYDPYAIENAEVWDFRLGVPEVGDLIHFADGEVVRITGVATPLF